MMCCELFLALGVKIGVHCISALLKLIGYQCAQQHNNKLFSSNETDGLNPDRAEAIRDADLSLH